MPIILRNSKRFQTKDDFDFLDQVTLKRHLQLKFSKRYATAHKVRFVSKYKSPFEVQIASIFRLTGPIILQFTMKI